ncbi:hypothetical protein [Clostridium estertheticum]|uniref:hypothetical protein n=1 Tax=Clostridium estertheticum TaxID=238834 RepID=UPI001C0CA9CC|nr:hypothetical protein [Clostridium estertheticum]MBU3171349.1 hypothetical protein [Clostridium estertheticum]
MVYNEPKMYFSNKDKTKGTEVLGTIANYKPPCPVLNNKGNKVLLGYTHFQEGIKADTQIKFSIVFDINTVEDINNFKKFRSKYNEYFYFKDELDTLYRGKFVGTYEIDSPIEGDIYYIALEMLCGHDIAGCDSNGS